MKWGLVTYQWGADWDLPTLIANCQEVGMAGVELRVEHAHGVGPDLSAAERADVRKRFDDSPVTFVGMGTNQDFDSPDPDKLRASIQGAKAYVVLSHDCGGSGVKVKPNSLHDGIDPDVTCSQIARSLNELGAFAEDYGQLIRLEIHGSCNRLPTIRKIMDQVGNRNVALCWNSNDQDLEGDGLEANFDLVKDRLGDTTHIRELDNDRYPYQDLIGLLARNGYDGWVLLEAHGECDDRVPALKRQRAIWREMVAKAR